MGQGSAAVPEEHGRQARTQLAGAGTALPGQMLHAVELGLHYSLDTRMLNAAFTDIYNLDTEAAHSVPSVEFTGVPVHGQGQFQSGPSGGTASQPWIHGGFYGPGHAETAGVFRSSNIVGAFGAKKQQGH